MKSKLIPRILFVATVIWIVLIFTLSSQNGAETAKTSLGVAETLANLFYINPSQQQILQMHLDIRKFAHVFLFFILGVLIIELLGHMSKLKSLSINHILIACMLTSTCGFLDEWYKQFIDGRHFQIDEALLNIIAGLTGILLVMIYHCIKSRKMKPN
jgi:VanZ family protein